MNKDKPSDKYVIKDNKFYLRKKELNLKLLLGRNYFKKAQEIKTCPNTYKNIYSIKTYTHKMNIFHNYMKNKKKSKIGKGMFSYKRNGFSSVSNSCETNSISKINSSLATNKNNHLILFSNLKLNDNTQFSSTGTFTNNDNISNNFPTLSSINLNKYKINRENSYNKNSISFCNTFNNINCNYDFLKYNNIIIKRNDGYLNQYFNRTEIMENKNNFSKSEIKLIKNFFREIKTKKQTENNRMIIELLKVLKLKHNNGNINDILKTYNISQKVLNKSINLNTIINYNSRNLTNSLISINSQIIEAPKKKAIIKNIKKFLNDMNDIKNDKIRMIKFLSLPRIMEMKYMKNFYRYIFMLVPSQLSYLNGIESYIFQWNDLKTRKVLGGFDLIKVNSCCVNYNDDKNFIIETFDGVFHRYYEIITVSNKISSFYVKSINYLSRLEKCKIYNNKK